MPKTTNEKILFWSFILLVEYVFIFLPYKVIDDDLSYYVGHFYRKVEKVCTKDQYHNPNQKSIKLAPLSGNMAGVCKLRPYSYTIEIDTEFWHRANAEQRYQVVMHELTHCVLNVRDHSMDPRHYMFASLERMTRAETEKQLDEMIAEKCKR